MKKKLIYSLFFTNQQEVEKNQLGKVISLYIWLIPVSGITMNDFYSMLDLKLTSYE